jgi:hypothetical protein
VRFPKAYKDADQRIGASTSCHGWAGKLSFMSVDCVDAAMGQDNAPLMLPSMRRRGTLQFLYIFKVGLGAAACDGCPPRQRGRNAVTCKDR